MQKTCKKHPQKQKKHPKNEKSGQKRRELNIYYVTLSSHKVLKPNGGFYKFPQIINNGENFNLFAVNSVLSESFC